MRFQVSVVKGSSLSSIEYPVYSIEFLNSQFAITSRCPLSSVLCCLSPSRPTSRLAHLALLHTLRQLALLTTFGSHNLDLHFYSLIGIIPTVSGLSDYFVDHIHSLGNLAKNSVLTIQKGCISNADKKL